MALFLSESDIKRLVSMTEAIAAVRTVFRMSGEGRVTNPPRQVVELPGGKLRVTTGVVPPLADSRDVPTLGCHPAILRAHEAYFDAVMNKGLLDRKLKEKIAYKVARLNECEYSTASHYRYALKCGASEEEMRAVRRHASKLDVASRNRSLAASRRHERIRPPGDG